MRGKTALGTALFLTLVGLISLHSGLQQPPVKPLDEALLREYEGVYRWGPDALLYLQLWDEFSGFDKPKQLVAFDEAGDIRVMFPRFGCRIS